MKSTSTSAPTSGRERVIGVAAGLFAERGFHGTSIRDVAVACGVRPSSLYNHVSDKNDMLVEIVSRYLDALDRRLPEAAEAPGDGADRLAAMIRVSLRVAHEFPLEFLTLSNSWTHIRRTPELAGLVARRDADRALWTAVMRAGAADGSLNAALDANEVLRIVFSAIHGSLDRRFDGVAPGAEGDAAATETLPTLLLDGLRPR